MFLIFISTFIPNRHFIESISLFKQALFNSLSISFLFSELLILEKLMSLDNLSNKELENMLEELGYGDNINLPYYGYNFNIVDE